VEVRVNSLKHAKPGGGPCALVALALIGGISAPIIAGIYQLVTWLA